MPGRRFQRDAVPCLAQWLIADGGGTHTVVARTVEL